MAGGLFPSAATAASASANVSVEIVDPVAIVATPPGPTSAAIGARIARLSAGALEVRGPAGQVFSVDIASSPTLARDDGSAAGLRVGLSTTGETGGAEIRVEGLTPLSGREIAGSYQASATVTVNFN